jgi:hypothetical protein
MALFLRNECELLLQRNNKIATYDRWVEMSEALAELPRTHFWAERVQEARRLDALRNLTAEQHAERTAQIESKMQEVKKLLYEKRNVTHISWSALVAAKVEFADELDYWNQMHTELQRL